MRFSNADCNVSYKTRATQLSEWKTPPFANLLESSQWKLDNTDNIFPDNETLISVVTKLAASSVEDFYFSTWSVDRCSLLDDRL